MWKREREADALTQYQATAAAAEPESSELPKFTSGLPSARPTTEGERHESELAEKSDPSSTRKVVRRVLIHGTWITVGLVAAVVAGNRESDEAPVVGECASIDDAENITKVDCGSDAAKFRVTSRVDDVSDGETACANDLTATSYYSYSSGHGIVDFVLCLADN